MELKLGGGGDLKCKFRFDKTYINKYFWEYLEKKTLNLYGPIIQKDPPPLANHFLTSFAFVWVTAVIAVGAL